LDRRPTEGPATSSDRDATLDTACRCYLANEAQMLASARRHLRLAGLEHEDPEDVWRDAQLKILDQLSAGRRLVAEAGDTQQDAYLKYGHAVLKLHVNDLRKKYLRRRTDTSDSLDLHVGGADVWQQTAHNLALSDWRRALLAKSERTRKVLAMSELGYSREEIAAALGVGIKRVGKIQEQGKPLRERVLASRGATRLQEICGGIATRIPLPAGVSAVAAKTAVGGGIAAMLTVAAVGGVATVRAVEHRQKQPAAAAEQGPASRPHTPAGTATRAPRPATRPVPPHHQATAGSTRTPTTATTLATHSARAQTAAPAPASQGATAVGALCSTQRICRPASNRPRTAAAPAPISAPVPARAQATVRTANAPANLCVQQGLCR
jgi:hypothetical protein